MSEYTPYVERTDIDWCCAAVYSFTSQGGPSPAGLRVKEVSSSRVGTITDGPHCTYGCTVQWDDGYREYVNTDRLTFYDSFSDAFGRRPY